MTKEKDISKEDIDAKLDAVLAGASSEAKAHEKKKAAPVADVSDNIELSASEQAELDAEVAAELAKELKAEKIKEYKAAKKQALKKQTLFRYGKDETGEDTELVLITLAPHMPYIRLDGDLYYPNRAYRLGKGKASVIKEQMYRGDLHENEILGKNMKNFYGQRPRNLVINESNPNGVAH